MRTVYLNGAFVHESEAKLSIYDLSVMQSAAAFEMTRSFNGKQFKLDEHLDRLWNSCRLLGIEYGHYDQALFRVQVRDICGEVTRRNDHGPGEEHRLLIVVSPGCAPMYKDLDGVIPHQFVYIADFPLRYTVAGFSKYFTEGVHCVTSPIQQVPDACVPSAAKHRSRLHFHLAQQQAPAGTWPILTTGKRWLCEAPGANLVAVRHAKPTAWKHTAHEISMLRWRALPGISLQTVADLCPEAGYLKRSRQYVEDANELWLTGTPFCMLPVVSLDGMPIGDGTPGPVYKATLAKWSDLVGVDIQQQIINWDYGGRCSTA